MTGIETVFFDFGGVLAEEGFHQGLRHIAQERGLDPDTFFETAVERIFATGYLVGAVDEAAWWEDLRQVTGIHGHDALLRNEILPRFTLRPRVLAAVEGLKLLGLRTAILSDQTNWLDELDAALDFFGRFHRVFNSYHVGLHKRDPECFLNALREMDTPAEKALFIDDAQRNVELAASLGLKVLHCRSQDQLERDLVNLFPALAAVLT